MKTALFVLYSLICGIYANGPERQSIGELGPHWEGKQYHYVGAFHNNHLYLMGDEEGNLGGKLADDIYVGEAFIVREDIQILLRDPKSGKFAVIDPSDPASRKMKEEDLKFHDAPSTNILAKGWLRAQNPKNYPKDLKKGKEKSWIYVDLTAGAGESDQFYVGTEIKKDPKTGYELVALLVVNQQRTTFYLDPKNKQFAPVKTDMLATPLEDIKYRKMDEGGAAEAALKVIQKTLNEKSDKPE